MNKIKNKKIEKTIDYKDEYLSNLFLRNSEYTGKSPFRKEESSKLLLNFISNAEKTISIATPSFLPSRELLKKLSELASRKVRIYLCLKNYETFKPFIKDRENIFLVRYGANFTGSFCIVDAKTNQPKFLWYSNNFENDKQGFYYEATEREVLGRFENLFNYLFWIKSKREFINWEEVKAKSPIDVTLSSTDFDKSMLIEYELSNFDNLRVIKNESTNHINNENIKDYFITKANIKNVDSITDKNIYVMDENIDMPNIIIADDTFYLLPDDYKLEHDFYVVFRYNLINIDIDKHFLYNRCTQNIEMKLCDAKAKTHDDTILTSDGLEIKIENERQIDLKIKEASSFEKFENENYFEDIQEDVKFDPRNIGKYAIKLIYKFDFSPPRKPSNTEKSSLYSEWSDFDKKYREKISVLRKKIETMKEKNDKTTNFFFKLFKTGKEQKISEYENNLSEFEEYNVSNESKVDYEKFKIRMKIFNELIKDINNDFDEVGKTLEESKDRDEWNTKKLEKEYELKGLKERLKEFLEKKDSLDKKHIEHSKNENELVQTSDNSNNT